MLFSHDGIHDSQTHLASPPYFYEQLGREISLAARTHKPLALIKILFENPESEQVRAHDILHFSHELTQLTRKEECIGRLGVN
jgi:GGDEF domain-containing protein